MLLFPKIKGIFIIKVKIEAKMRKHTKNKIERKLFLENIICNRTKFKI